MQDETALYGAKMMQPGMTAADSEENNLRPQHLEDYIGQEKVKQNLKIYLEAAKRRGKRLTLEQLASDRRRPSQPESAA